MTNYKAYSVGHYLAGVEYMTDKISFETFKMYINNNEKYVWADNESDRLKDKISKDEDEIHQKCFYNVDSEQKYDMEISHNSFGGTLTCFIYRNENKCLTELKKIANRLNCNVYKNNNMIHKSEDENNK